MPLNRNNMDSLQHLQLPPTDFQHYPQPSPCSAYSGAYSDEELQGRPAQYGHYAPQYPPNVATCGPDPSASFGGAPPSPISPVPQPYFIPQPYSNYPQYPSSYPPYTSHSAPQPTYARLPASPFDYHPLHHSADNSPREHSGPYQQTGNERNAVPTFDPGNAMHEHPQSYYQVDSWVGSDRSWQDHDNSGARNCGLPTPAYASPPTGAYPSPDGYFGPRGAQGKTEYGKMECDEDGSPRDSDGEADSGKPETTTPFISKLAHILSHAEYSAHIRWNREGTAVVFAQGSPDLVDVLTRFFRHSNCHSFVRQLNIYGFTRLTTLDLLTAIESTPHATAKHGTDYAAFAHPLFYRGAGRLHVLKPNPPKNKKPQKPRKKSQSPYAREQYLPIVSKGKGDRSSISSVSSSGSGGRGHQ